jgi:predicted Zn-dependent protease
MDFRVSVVPVGRIDPQEIESAASRIAKVLNRAVALRQSASVPKAGDDPARGQHLAGPFLADLKGQLPRLALAKEVGTQPQEPTGEQAPGPVVAVTVFVTDVDLYKPQTDGAFGHIDAPGRVAVLSVRRLREAFYKRKVDPAKARARLVKLALYALARAHGLPECNDRGCALSATASLADIDMKPEKYCVSCWRRMTTGAYRI